MNPRRGPRPHTWKYGPDPVIHHQHTAWLHNRVQARYRGEPYDLTFAEFCMLWQGHWHRRGRGWGCLNLTRRDTTVGWTVSNCRLQERSTITHARNFGPRRSQKKILTQTPKEEQNETTNQD